MPAVLPEVTGGFKSQTERVPFTAQSPVKLLDRADRIFVQTLRPLPACLDSVSYILCVYLPLMSQNHRC